MGIDYDPPPPVKDDKIARLIARANTVKTTEYPKWPSSATGGVIPMSIVGRFVNERERLGPEFTEADRQWRIKWHKDQELHPNEPYEVPALERELNNPIRRFYKTPLNYVEKNFLVPRLGVENGGVVRALLGKGALIYITACYMWYTLKYSNANTWERYWGWRIKHTRPVVLPNDPAYPLPNPRPNPEDFCDRGFKARTVFLDKD